MDTGIFKQYLTAFIASLSVMTAGTAYGWINPLLVRLLSPDSEVPMTPAQSSWVVALIELGDLFTPLPAAMLVDIWGRKPLLILIAPVYIFSWIMVLLTNSVYVLYFIRVIQGCAMGVVYTILPMYLSEIAEPKVRGAIGTFFEGMLGIGILLEYSLGPYITYDQLSLISLAVPVLFLFTFITMPESPYFLVMSDQPEKALKSLTWLRAASTSPLVDELKGIKDSIKEEMALKENQSLKALFASKANRRAFIIVQVVTLTKYMSGIGAVLSYSSQTFGETSRSFLSPEEFTIIMGTLNLAATLIASMFVDRMGRRPLLLASSFGCALFNSLAALYFYLQAYMDLSNYSWVPFVCITSYCICYSLGIGPVVPILQAELFPTNIRALACGITTLTDTFTCLVCMKLYQVLDSYFGVYLNYLIYSLSSLAGMIVIYSIVPETKGSTFSEIQEVLTRQVQETTPIRPKEQSA